MIITNCITIIIITYAYIHISNYMEVILEDRRDCGIDNSNVIKKTTVPFEHISENPKTWPNILYRKFPTKSSAFYSSKGQVKEKYFYLKIHNVGWYWTVFMQWEWKSHLKRFLVGPPRTTETQPRNLHVPKIPFSIHFYLKLWFFINSNISEARQTSNTHILPYGRIQTFYNKFRV